MTYRSIRRAWWNLCGLPDDPRPAEYVPVRRFDGVYIWLALGLVAGVLAAMLFAM